MPVVKSLTAFAEKQGFKTGDDIVKLGGFPFIDELDYVFYDSESKFEAELLRKGEKLTIKVKKRAEQPLGLEFGFDMKPFCCKNNCVFCFVSQLPKGLRETLYVKDDDYRFSFISGSYVTLTNVSDAEIDRIIRLKLSPLYISVHAFDDDVRHKMLKNPNTLKLIPYMRRLGEAGIKMHTQLVIVPGINDGKILEESVRGLRSVKGVESVAVVPVGLTSHRKDLPDIRPVSEKEARETINLIEKLYDEFGGFCYCSDEYYVKAGMPHREYSYYGDFAQIENGVGLIADFEDNLDYASECAEPTDTKLKLAFVTGESFAPLLSDYVKPIAEKTGSEITVVPVRNSFFGESVTVAGLITAADIIRTFKEREYTIGKTGGNVARNNDRNDRESVNGINTGEKVNSDETKTADNDEKKMITEERPNFDAIVIPDNMLREFTDTFLDNVGVNELEKELGMPVIVAAHNGSDLPQVIIGFAEKRRKK